ncbi:MAG: hypothetical protein GXY88_09630 [Tissierellia bacterium]|nr:hypothetical protein [Tissierellia bacterium]
MSADFTYFRKYIVLKNDYTNIDSIKPKGHGKMEIRGNKGLLSLNVENCEEEESYRVYFLKSDNKGIYDLDIGRIFTDDRGRSRTNISFNLKDLEERGFPLNKIDAILIKKGINILLGGYIDRDNKTIDRLIKAMELEEKEESPPAQIEREEVIEPVPEEITPKEDSSMELEEEEKLEKQPLIEPTEVGEKEEEGVEETTTEPVIEAWTEGLEELPMDKPTEEVAAEEPPSEEVAVEEKGEEESGLDGLDEGEKGDTSHEYEFIKPLEDTVETEEIEAGMDIAQEPPMEEDYTQPNYNFQSLEYMRRLKYKNRMTDYVLSILRFFPKVQPLKIYLHGYSWWRIDDDGTGLNRGFLPYYNYLMSANYRYPFLYNSTTCLDQIRKYGHYLFGLYREGKDTKYYVYAVPGKFTIEEHPFRGITGFNTWYDSMDGIGYWVLYIDPMTGNIIYPINPMVPSE